MCIKQTTCSYCDKNIWVMCRIGAPLYMTHSIIHNLALFVNGANKMAQHSFGNFTCL